MNNVQKFNELRRMAVERGFPKERDLAFYVPERTLNNGRQYFPNNADNALVFYGEWQKALFGTEPEETGWLNAELDPVAFPAYKASMLKCAEIQAGGGDVIGWLYARATGTPEETQGES